MFCLRSAPSVASVWIPHEDACSSSRPGKTGWNAAICRREEADGGGSGSSGGERANEIHGVLCVERDRDCI